MTHKLKLILCGLTHLILVFGLCMMGYFRVTFPRAFSPPNNLWMDASLIMVSVLKRTAQVYAIIISSLQLYPYSKTQ